MRTYKLIGLTGTTGSGKGEARKVFEQYGCSVIDADLLAREIMSNPVVLNSLQSFFGADVVEDGRLNRSLLAQRAFASKEKTNLLNSITHPHITTLFLSELNSLAGGGAQTIVFDAPQLFESKLDALCDCVVAVIAEEGVRAERIMKRDNLTREEAEARIKAQFSDEYFRENSDYIIENNSTVGELKLNAEKIIEIIRR